MILLPMLVKRKLSLIPLAVTVQHCREHVIQNPFTCETAREWRPNLTCEDAPDIEQDGSRLWAIDKPSIPNQVPRLFPSVDAYTVQCDLCLKWRLIPTAERYAEIREHFIQNPFTCETAREWRPDITCEDAPDIEQDGSELWAIDRPNIPTSPPGWQRSLRIRAEEGSKFADVYYGSPSRKRPSSSTTEHNGDMS